MAVFVEVFMDFGNILDQWDKMNKEKENKKKTAEGNKPRKRLANAPTLEKEETEDDFVQEDCVSQVNPMDVWLRRYGVIDKDAANERAMKKELSQDREYLKKLPPDAKIDLHGLTRDEAWSKLDSFINDCCRRGVKKILIVHGKGNHSENPGGVETGNVSVLSAMVRTFVECDNRLGASGHPDKKLGGSGATWAIIKRK